MPICPVYLRGCVVAKSPKKKGPETGPLAHRDGADEQPQRAARPPQVALETVANAHAKAGARGLVGDLVAHEHGVHVGALGHEVVVAHRVEAQAAIN